MEKVLWMSSEDEKVCKFKRKNLNDDSHYRVLVLRKHLT